MFVSSLIKSRKGEVGVEDGRREEGVNYDHVYSGRRERRFLRILVVAGDLSPPCSDPYAAGLGNNYSND